MTEQEYNNLNQPEKWKLIALYQNKQKVFMVDENSVEDMNRFFEWLLNK